MARSRTLKAGIMALGYFLRAIVGLVSLAILARVLTEEHYATYKQTIFVYMFISSLLILGLPDVLYYFLPIDKDRARGVLRENLMLLGIMGMLFSLFLVCGGNRLLAWGLDNPALAQTLMVFAPYTMLMLPMLALDSCLLARDKVPQVAIFNVLNRVVMLVIVVGAVLIWRTSTAAIIAVVISAAVMFTPAMALMYSATRGTRSDISLSGAKSQLKLSIPLALAGMLAMFSEQIDKVIVFSMREGRYGLKEVAVYLNGAIELPLIMVVTISAMSVIMPDLTICYKEGRLNDMLVLWRRTAEKCLAVLAPAMAFVLVMAPELMTVLFSSAYTNSAYPLRIYALLLPIRAVQMTTLFVAAGRSGFITIAAMIGLLANVVLSVFFVNWMGPTGAAWATVISIYVMRMSVFVAMGSILKCRLTDVIRFPRVAWTILVACLPGAAIFAIREFMPGGSVVRLAVLTPVFAILLLLAYHITGIMPVSRVTAVISRRFFASNSDSDNATGKQA
ncbi:MAG: polysaccharide biosynthesis protein [bacterium]|nr:polysaccharide biosynthesis protein [bacterium]